MARTCFSLLFVTLFATMPAGAQTVPPDFSIAVVASPEDAAATVVIPIEVRPASRPSVLPATYVALMALQSYDAYSTLKIVRQGGIENNPLMGGAAGVPPAFIAIKAATTVVTIFWAERLWREHHRKTAIVLMVLSNSMMAVVGMQNASVLRQQQR
jgi:hypothetical protein